MTKGKCLAIIAATVLLLVPSCTAPASSENREPVITSLQAEAEEITPLGTAWVTCNASDPDGDELTYNWSASAGTIDGQGSTVTWKPPNSPGSYNITVTASDSHGGSAMDSLCIRVVPIVPPVIEDLIITKDRYGHCYLKPYSEGYYVGKEQRYDIECVASHPQGLELSYNWTCGGGEISGNGSIVVWTAPDTSGYVTVTVIVCDMASNVVSKSLVLTVVECSPCTFGYCTG
ncbi:MAG: Ig-like domain-containing protein [Dehalococcoidia bacterium]